MAAASKSEYSGIVLVPAIKDFGVFKPGRTYDGSFTVENRLDKKIQIVFEIYDLDQDKNGAPVLIENGAREFSIKQWIKLCCNSVVLGPKEKKTIRYKINVPKNEPPGGKYAAIIAKIQGEGKFHNVAISAGIGHVIIGESNIAIKRDSRILSFEVLNKINFKWPSYPTSFKLVVKNNGNVHERITGSVFIYKKTPTNTYKVISVNPEKTLIFPGRSREYNIVYKDDPIFDIKDGSLSLNFKAIKVGRYHALLRGKHFENNKLITEERIVSFWLLPWWLIFIILALFTIIGKIIYGLRK